jgi:hypothetical protein
MTITIRRLEDTDTDTYESFVRGHPDRLIYYSKSYRDFLRKVLVAADDDYFVAYEVDRVVGVLPSFTLETPVGTVVNSLPFFGSHGGPLVDPECHQSAAVALLDAFDTHCRKVGAITSTIIDHPLIDDLPAMLSRATDYFDHRIAQFIELPGSAATEQDSMTNYHQKTRNSVRKALGGDFSFQAENSDEAWSVLEQLHTTNLQALGGVAKSRRVFRELRETFDLSGDTQLWSARSNSTSCIVAAVLLLRFEDTLEYFIPAISTEHRPSQVLSGVIHNALSTARSEGTIRLWNWGGTWMGQDGVYRFKSRWGSSERNYTYRIRKYTESVPFPGMSQDDLLGRFPYFYTLPFNKLDVSAVC